MEAHLFGRLIPAREAQRRLMAAVRPVDRTESVRIEEAFGRVSARRRLAPRPVPGFDRASWDGYAVRSQDLRGASAARPRGLRVVGEVFAEQAYGGRVGPGEAVAIATGGALPRGSDAVEIFENVRRDGRTVWLRAPVRPGARIAPAGDDFPRGARLTAPGELLGPATLGSLAASGAARATVYARPVVALVPNGNELRVPPGRLGPGEIFESNNASIAAFVRAAGAVPRTWAPVRDDPRAIEAALREACRTSDLVLATGGSSVGERDHLGHLFPKLGRLLFHGIAVRPGKPTLAARAGSKLLIGLPGHPASCLLNLHWLVLPVLRRLGHLPGPGWSAVPARWEGPSVPANPELTTVLPVQLREGRARSTFRSSSVLRSLRGADGFTFVRPGGPTLRAGGPLTVSRLDPPLGSGFGGGGGRSA